MSLPSFATVSKNMRPFVQEHENSNLEASLIFGTPSAGKSTFCQLLLANVSNMKNENLTFKEDKGLKTYALPGVISSNSFKIETIRPRIYDVVEKEEVTKVIDLPTSCLPPMSDTYKKFFSAADSKLTLNLFCMCIKKANFILMIEEKHTRTPAVLRGILANFLDIFSEFYEDLPEQLLNSTCIIISKSPEIKMDLLIKKFEGCNKKVEDNKTKKINDWIQNLKKRNAIYFFKKFVNEETTKQEVQVLFKSISSTAMFDLAPDVFQLMNRFPHQIREEILKFFQNFEKALKSILQILLYVGDGFTDSYEQYSKDLQIVGCTLFGLEKKKTHEGGELPNVMKILNVCRKFCEFQKKIQDTEYPDLTQLVDELIKNEILLKDEDLTEVLYEISFLNNKMRKFDVEFPWDLQALAETLGEAEKIKKNQKLLEEIVNNFNEQIQEKSYFEGIKQILAFLMNEQQREANQLASTIWIKSALAICDLETDKSKALVELLNLQGFVSKMGKNSLLGQLLEKIANILISVGELPSAITIYEKTGNTQIAIEKMNNFFSNKSLFKNRKIEDFEPYLGFLQNSGLYERSYETCALLGSFYVEVKEREVLEKFLKKAPAAPSQKYLESFIKQKFSGLSQDQIQRFQELASKLKP